MGDRAHHVDNLDEELVEPFRWRLERISPGISICVGPTRLLLRQGFNELAPEDESGARGLLIAALCAEFNVSPQSIEIFRPRLTAGLFRRSQPGYVLITDQERRRAATRRIWISLSRSDELVAVGIGLRRLGIDIERCQSPTQSDDLLSLIHPRDRLRAQSRSGLDRQYETTAIWTRIEAVAKLHGTGLRTDPSNFRVGASNGPGRVGKEAIMTVGCDELGRPRDFSPYRTHHCGSSVPEYAVSLAHW